MEKLSYSLHVAKQRTLLLAPEKPSTYIFPSFLWATHPCLSVPYCVIKSPFLYTTVVYKRDTLKLQDGKPATFTLSCILLKKGKFVSTKKAIKVLGED